MSSRNFLALSALFLVIVSNIVLGDDGASMLVLVDCFDYYNFGSVKLSFDPDLKTIAVGNKITFSGFIKNESGHPIVKGMVLAKVMRMDDFSPEDGPSLIADQFVAVDKISIADNMKKYYSFSWNVPVNLKPGKYVLATYFISENKYNYAGLSFTEDVVGSLTEFNVTNNEIKEFVYFDRKKAFLNNEKHNFVGFIREFGPKETVKAGLSLVNETNENLQIPVKWKLYKWDAADEKNLLEEKTELIEIKPKEARQLSYLVTDTTEPVYYLVAEAKYKDAKSILGIRFARAGIDKVRINSPGVFGYPLEKEHFSRIFTCVHGVNESNMVTDNKLIMELLDKDGKVLGSWFYEGPITGAMMGLTGDIKVTDYLPNFKINSRLYHKNVIVDSSIL